MNRDDLAYFLTLDQCPGIGPVTFRKLIEVDDFNISSFISTPSSQLTDLGLSQKQISALKNPDQKSIDNTLEWLESDNAHHILVMGSPDYPNLLTQIIDAPSILYAVGRVELLNTPQLAIVGSRNCTPGGASTAKDFAAHLAQSGFTITSGMALGIDKHAHQGALETTTNTIAVIGTGCDRIYPSRNRHLAHQIAEKGLIISEFPLGTAPNSNNFPKRNRVISGLSVATLIVEAARKSGSLITAHCSLEQGREVFAIPGSIHNPQVKGCHQLIREGAKLVEQASDIIDEIGSLLGVVAQQTAPEATTEPAQLSADYQQLLDIIGYDPVSIDTLSRRCSLTIEQLSSMLLILELKDHIQTAPGGLYVRR